MASSSKSGINWKGFFNMIAFISLIMIGIALILIKLLKAGEITDALQSIAECLAYITVAFYAFFYANRKRGDKRIWYLVAWAVAVVLVVLGVILKM